MNKSGIKKLMPYIYVSGFAILIGILQGIVSKVIVNGYFLLDESPKVSDYLNYILMSDRFGEYVYLEKGDLQLLFQPVVFYMCGLFVAGYNFLWKDKGYYQFVYSRLGNERELVNELFFEKISLIFVYCILYMITIFLMGICSFDGSIYLVILQGMVWNCVNKIAFLIMLKSLLLHIYLRKGLAKSVLYGCIFSGMFIMLDAMLGDINFVLYSLKSPYTVLAEILVCIISVRMLKKIDLLNI